MATNEREVKLKISTIADGSESIAALGKEVSALAKEGGAATPVFERLGQELTALADQQALISELDKVQTESKQTANALVDAEVKLGELGKKLQEQTARASEFRESQTTVKNALVDTAKSIESVQGELRLLRQSSDTATKSTDDYKNRVAELNKSLTDLRIKQIEQTAQQKEINAEVQKSEKAVKSNSAAYDYVTASVEKLNAQLAAQRSTLQSSTERLAASAASTTDLGTAQAGVALGIAKITAELEKEKQALAANATAQKAVSDAAVQAERATADAVKAANLAYNDKIALLKANAQVDAQVIASARAKIQADLDSAKSSQQLAKAKGDEKAAAQALIQVRDLEVGQSKLSAQSLRQEANAAELLTLAKREYLAATGRLTPAIEAELLAEKLAIQSKRDLAIATEQAAIKQRTLAETTKTTGGAFAGLGGFVRGALVPIQALIATFAGLTEFVRVNVELENIARTFKSLTGSSEGARREMQFVTDVSNRLGLELVGTAKAFAQFSAATKGSSLEGEQTRVVFESVARAMALAGRSAAETEAALNALGQTVSKGTVQMEELRGQLGDRLPGALKIAADSAGLTTAQLINLVENGQVLAEDLLPRLAVGLNTTFQESADTAGTTSQQFNRLRNAISQTFADIGDSGILKFLIAAGAALSTFTVAVATFSGSVLGSFGAAIAAVSTGLYDLGKAIVTLDFSNLLDKWSESATRFKDVVSDSFAKSGEIIQRFLDLIPGIGEEAKTAAQGADTLAASVSKTGVEAFIASKNWIGLITQYRESRKSIEGLIVVSEKNVEAKKVEAQTITTLAALQGDETRIREAAVEAAKLNQEALRGLSLARTSDLDVLQNQLAAEKLFIETTKDTSEERLKQIADLEKLIASKKEDAEKSLQQLNASKLVTEQAQIELQTYKDNSASVKELGERYQELTKELAVLADQKKRGISNDDELIEKQKELAEASRLYADAIKDQVENINASLSAKQAGNNLDQLTVKLAIEEATTARDVAKARGDEAGVRSANAEIRRLENQLAQLQVDLLRAEAEAALEVVNAKRQEILARRELTKVEEAEFKAQELGAQAKIKQSQIQEEILKRSQKVYEATEQQTAANNRSTTSYDKLGTSAKKASDEAVSGALASAGALDKLGDRILITADRYKGLTKEQAAFYERVDRAINELTDATLKLDKAQGNNPGAVAFAKSLDEIARAADAATAANERLLASRKRATEFDAQGYEVNTEGQRVAATDDPAPYVGRNGNWYYVDKDGQLRTSGNRQPIKDPSGKGYIDPANQGSVNDFSTPQGGKFGGAGNGSTTPGSVNNLGVTSATQSGTSTTHTVNINLGGGSTTSINAASENDAQALVTLFRQLGSDKARVG